MYTKNDILKKYEEEIRSKDLHSKTVEIYLKTAEDFFIWCENSSRDLNKIDLLDVLYYCRYIKDEKLYAKEKYNLNVYVLKALVKHMGIYIRNREIPYIRSELEKSDILSVEEIKIFISNISSLKYRTIMLIMYLYALLPMNAAVLRYEDISRKKKEIHISGTERTYERYLPLDDFVLEKLTEYWYKYNRPVQWLFPNDSDKGTHVSAYDIMDVMRENIKDLHWENKNIKRDTLRCSRATHLYNEGIGWEKIVVFLGNKNINAALSCIYTDPLEVNPALL